MKRMEKQLLPTVAGGRKTRTFEALSLSEEGGTYLQTDEKKLERQGSSSVHRSLYFSEFPG